MSKKEDSVVYGYTSSGIKEVCTKNGVNCTRHSNRHETVTPFKEPMTKLSIVADPYDGIVDDPMGVFETSNAHFYEAPKEFEKYTEADKNNYPSINDVFTRRGIDVEEKWAFGDYQGDYVFLVNNNGEKGIAVVGYGSCSYCDAFQDATEPWHNYDLETEEMSPDFEKVNANMARFSNDSVNKVFYGTKDELVKYLDEGTGLKWYDHDKDFLEKKAEIINKINTL